MMQARRRAITRSPVRFTSATRSAVDVNCRGGDVLEVLTNADGAIWVLLADVSSKGTLGIFHAEMVRSAFHAAVRRTADPALVIVRLNEVRFDIPRRDMQVHFASAFVACIDTAKPELTYASAGHDIALLLDGRNHRHLEPTGPVLGIFPEFKPATKTMPFEVRALLVLGSDGITEARCAAEPAFEFGTTGLVRAVLQAGSVRSKAEYVARCTDSFTQSHYRDDATIAVIERM
jgi:phosphoserine phosphatase RsbU/P